MNASAKATSVSPQGAAPTLLPVLSVNFVGTLGFSIVVPFLVFLVTKWGGNALIYGLIGATYSAFQFVGAPILGRWSDRVGRRKILLLSQFGTLASWGIFLLAFFTPVQALAVVNSPVFGDFQITLPLLLLFLARAADGITGGNVSVANAYLADISDEEHRSRNFGRMALSGNLGFVLGPALAGLLGASAYGEILPVIAAMLISVVALSIIAFGLRDFDPCKMEPVPRGSLRRVFGQEQKDCFKLGSSEEATVRQALRLPHIAGLLVAYFLVMLGFSFFYIGFPVHAVERLGWTVTGAGSFFAYLSLCMVVAQGPLLSWASTQLADRHLAMIGTCVLAAGFAALALDGNIATYGAATLIALGNGIMWPSVLSLLAAAAGDTHQGTVQGLGGSVGAVASVLGLVVGGLLYNALGAWLFVLAALSVLPVVGLLPGASGEPVKTANQGS